MSSFDVVSEIDEQEVKNAVAQATKEIDSRFDFKGTDSSIELGKDNLTLASATEDRLKAVVVVLEEKFVKRGISLKCLDYGKVEQATKGTVRQDVKLVAGINQENAKKIGAFIKGLGLKGVTHANQGDSLRVNSKKRDELQAVIAALKGEDMGVPLQFENFRD